MTEVLRAADGEISDEQRSQIGQENSRTTYDFGDSSDEDEVDVASLRVRAFFEAQLAGAPPSTATAFPWWYEHVQARAPHKLNPSVSSPNKRAAAPRSGGVDKHARLPTSIRALHQWEQHWESCRMTSSATALLVRRSGDLPPLVSGRLRAPLSLGPQPLTHILDFREIASAERRETRSPFSRSSLAGATQQQLDGGDAGVAACTGSVCPPRQQQQV